MSQVVGLPSNSYKPITNTAWVRARLCKLQKGCTRLAAASDKAYQLLAYGRWFSPGTPASFTTKAGRHDIAKILLKVALNTINQSWYQCTIYHAYHLRLISNHRQSFMNTIILQKKKRLAFKKRIAKTFKPIYHFYFMLIIISPSMLVLHQHHSQTPV